MAFFQSKRIQSFIKTFGEMYEIEEDILGNGFVCDGVIPVTVELRLLDEDSNPLQPGQSENRARLIEARIESYELIRTEDFEITDKHVFSKDLIAFLIRELQLPLPETEQDKRNAEIIRNSELGKQLRSLNRGVDYLGEDE